MCQKEQRFSLDDKGTKINYQEQSRCKFNKIGFTQLHYVPVNVTLSEKQATQIIEIMNAVLLIKSAEAATRGVVSKKVFSEIS